MILIFDFVIFCEVKMKNLEQYIISHFQSGAYVGSEDGSGAYENALGWTDNAVAPSLIFSHRSTPYTRESFTEGLHNHDFYELLIYVDGDIEYIKDDTVIRPQKYSAIWFTPGQMHTARLLSPSRYERYVIYFYEDFFSTENGQTPITDFIGKGADISFDEETKRSVVRLLESVKSTLASDANYRNLLARAYLTELFAALNESCAPRHEYEKIDGDMARVKRYIDEEYATIENTSSLAEKFYYSREHLSRRFCAEFNITLHDYLAKRRINESLPYLETGSVAQASYAVGFHSQSAYISAFVKNMGCLPSEYKRRIFGI